MYITSSFRFPFYFFLALTICLSTEMVEAQTVTSWETFQRTKQINDVLETAEATYLATDAGIFVVDPESRQITDHWTRATAGLPSNRVEGMAIDPNSSAFIIGTYDLGVFRSRPDNTWEAETYPGQHDRPHTRTYCLAFAPGGDLLVGTSLGLMRLHEGEWEVTDRGNTDNSLFAVWKMIEAPDGTVYAGGTVTLAVTADTLEIINPVDDNTGFFKLFAYGDVDLFQADNGDVWLFTDVNEAGRYDGENWEIYQSDDFPVGVFQNPESFAYAASDGTIWKHVPGEGYLKLNGEAWIWAENSHLPENTKSLVATDAGHYLLYGDTLALLEETGLTGVGTTSSFPWPTDMKGLRTSNDNQSWAIIGQDLINLTTTETTELNLGDFNFRDFRFNPLTNDLWLWNYHEIVQYRAGEIVARFGFNAGTFPTDWIRAIIISEDGTPWAWTQELEIYAFVDNNWQLVHNFPEDHYIYGFHPGEGRAVRVALYGQQNFTLYDLNMDGPVEITTNDELNVAFGNSFSGADPGVNWIIDIEELTLLRYDGLEWTSLELPPAWQQLDFAHSFTEIDGKIMIAADHQFALYNGTEWTYFNADNSPLDTDDLQSASMDATGTLWLKHFPTDILEKVTTNLTVNTRDIAVSEIQALKLFPNPTADIINFTTEQPATYDLLSFNGQNLKKGSIPAGNQRIYLGDLPTGTYVLRVIERGGIRTGRFVKD